MSKSFCDSPKLQSITSTPGYFKYLQSNKDIHQKLVSIFDKYPDGIGLDAICKLLDVNSVYLSVTLAIWESSPCTFYKYGIVSYTHIHGLWAHIKYDNTTPVEFTRGKSNKYKPYIEQLKYANSAISEKLEFVINLCLNQADKINQLEKEILNE